MKQLEDFAAELGVLFQIVDDILDVTGAQEQLGKELGNDERLGKRTYVTEFGLTEARALARETHQRGVAALERALPAPGSELREITDFIAERSY
jgi:geranylgeranyl diphosphate synthase type II